MTHHYSIEFGTPIYCCAFIDSRKIILGAGGGTTKSGITNKLTIIQLDPPNKSSNVTTEFNLEKGEDVPMSMEFDRSNKQLICGINAPLLSSSPEKNLHLRTFSLEKNQQLKSKTAQRVLTYESEDNYQRITCLSDQAPKLLAVGGTNNQLDLLNYPSLRPAFNTIWCTEKEDQKSQLLAVDFHPDGSQFLVGSSRHVKLFSTKRKLSKKGSKKIFPPDLIRQFEPPSTSANQNTSFRNVMYGRGINSKTVYTIVNHLPNKGDYGRKSNSIWPRSDQRKAVLISWNLDDGQQRRSKMISNKPVTSFDISSSGKLLAFSSSDLSIGILDASSLRSLLSILHAHEFPVTSIKFSPDEERVVSCSADMTIRVIELDKSILDRSSKQLFILISLIILLIGFLIKFLN
ncbi:hypothetical protein PGT21_036494 [Puccinia graminis f. sp. tritici]|uniref:Uncharacterized protein n=2 Tax=Puccinia graminis f. sp. tritici TaxID=56615 RepID=E3KWF9_PUCGT|nr:uncharacterized protein PGTG_14839 [Puccinia graminis f. sp. tritici CRL 75-36-700-3]EFP88634.2 hypothetical protein PGTG_14839 [Puccinia graminis f. sp. tritici CRL 75-36-700-3]KAA1091646.1 hypothetical protein PGT21_036494 [Puccinia graminis f. sp. tritici]KAA1138799.1 hypothetical protein PGTUg99_012376 [Puccinia graminis f. sp. tritici]